MSSPSPSSKSNGSRRRRRRTRSPSASASTASDSERSQVEEASFNNAPEQGPADNESPKVTSVHTELAETNPLQPIQSSARTSSHGNVKGVQADATAPLHGGPSGTWPLERGNQEVLANNPTRKSEAHNQEDRIQRVQIEPDRLGWARMYDLTRKFDEDRVKDIKEDIDTLLVFAGLFSAVVTAFIIESYKNLQQQPEDMTNEILLRVSAQLAGLSINGNLINSTAPSFAPTPFMTTRPMVLINTLWALSLVIALITASLGILVKQWFHELLSYETHDPKERLKLRFFREAGIERWRVFAIASSLPLLLQLALLFFFIGFSVFLHGLDLVVGWVTTGVMVSWLAVFLFTAFTPAFSSQCPYKIPLLKQFLYQLRFGYVSRLHGLFHQWYQQVPSYSLRERCFETLRDWMKARLDSKEPLEEGFLFKNNSLDMPTVVCVRDLLRGEKLNDAVFHPFENVGIEKVIEMFYKSLKQDPVNHGLIPDVSDGAGSAMHILLWEFIEREGTRSLIALVGEHCNPITFLQLHTVLSLFPSQVYDSASNYPVSKPYLSLFIQLIQEGFTSAAFAILTMCSIRLRTLVKHPDKWDDLFSYLSETERQSYGIGDQFISNLLVATKTLIHSLWNRQRSESDIQQIADCVAAIRDDAGDSDPAVTPDPIAFIYVFAEVLNGLTPFVVVQKHRERVFEVMGELAEIFTDLDGSSWSYSRKECAEWASRHLYFCGLHDEQNLRPKLRTLINTWDPDWPL